MQYIGKHALQVNTLYEKQIIIISNFNNKAQVAQSHNSYVHISNPNRVEARLNYVGTHSVFKSPPLLLSTNGSQA